MCMWVRIGKKYANPPALSVNPFEGSYYISVRCLININGRLLLHFKYPEEIFPAVLSSWLNHASHDSLIHQ